jgi:anti-sigma-K factor RskA
MSDRQADDLAAGEYVLGLLEGAALAEFERRLAGDRALAALVARWREHFSALDATAAPVRASPALWDKIETSLGRGDVADETPRLRQRLWSSLGFWRGASFAGAVASLMLAIALGLLAGRATPRPIVIAVMQTGEASPGAIVQAFADGSLTIVPLKDFDIPPGLTMQLWTLWDKQKGPVSVGLINRTHSARFERADLPAGETQIYEITIEPAGGSPTGRPTGPVLVKGYAATPR